MPGPRRLSLAAGALMVCCSACAPGPRSTSAAPEQGPSPTPAPSLAAVEAPPAGTPDRQPKLSTAPLSELTMLELSASEGAWATITDPARGLVVVDFHDDASGEDPRANKDGVVEHAQHLCGGQLAAEAGRIFTDLRSRVEQRDPEYGPVFTCKGMSCTHEAEMEFDHEGEFVFVAGPKGPLLDHVVRLEGGSATEAFRKVGRDFARAELARLAGARCD